MNTTVKDIQYIFIGTAIIVSSVFIFVSAWLLLSAVDRELPITDPKIVLVTPKVVKGEKFKVKLSGNRTRLCPVEANRLIYDADNHVIVNEHEKEPLMVD